MSTQRSKTAAAAKKRAQLKSAAPATPYSPTQVTTYPDQKSFDTAVDVRARGQLAPQLNDIRARRREELGAHEARTADIQGYYDYDLAARQAAQTRLDQSLQGILGRQDVLGEGAKAGLAAALRQTADTSGAAATQLGVQAPGVDPQVAAALAARTKGNQMGLAGEFGQHLALGASDIGLTGVERRQAGEREAGVSGANLKALGKERTDLTATLPALREGARSSMLQEILANSQNKLAWRQFGLGQDQFGETVRSNKAQEALGGRQATLAENQFGEAKKARKFDEGEALKQSQLNQDQLNLARDELNAKIDEAGTTQDAQTAETQAKQFDAAAQWLSGFLAPTDSDYNTKDGKKSGFSKKKYDRRVNDKQSFNRVMDQLTTRFGLDLETAYRVASTAELYKGKANKFLQALGGPSYGGPH